MIQVGIGFCTSLTSRRCHVGGIAAAALLMSAMMPAQAQTFVRYACADGTPVVAAFYQKDNTARIQVDGKSLTLPQRLSADGGRYAKGGVSFWIKGDQATLKRPKVKATVCKVQ